MKDIFNTGVAYLWTALWIVWLVSALTAKRSVQRQTIASRLEQTILVTTAFFLLFDRRLWPRWLRQRVLPAHDDALLWTGLILTAAGVSFAILARFWIGRNWSGTITIKEQHELIQSGPYRIVRHPIYTGLLLAYLSTAIVHGELRGFVGFFLLLLGFGLKLRMEEAFMVQQFGNAYLDYKQRVKALVPFVV
ncbi:MAG: isoprenylcysteine carboxylmethyltransferase family protein [Acidobacteriia bacterium]|nr:isoprenylcysteine carboxylmethyltransferase family protein [Terriglobia bacterium]